MCPPTIAHTQTHTKVHMHRWSSIQQHRHTELQEHQREKKKSFLPVDQEGWHQQHVCVPKLLMLPTLAEPHPPALATPISSIVPVISIECHQAKPYGSKPKSFQINQHCTWVCLIVMKKTQNVELCKDISMVQSHILLQFQRLSVVLFQYSA